MSIVVVIAMHKQAIIILVAGILVLGGIGATVFLLNQQQDTRSRAQLLPTLPPKTTVTPTGIAQTSSGTDTCPAPAQVQGVTVEYPGCEGDECQFSQASCAWSPSQDATSYNLVITEVDSGTAVKNETIANSIAKVIFPVTQGKTYKCDLSAVNSCGSVSVAATDQLLCDVDAIIPTATPVVPTVAPTQAASPTATIAPTATLTPTPTIEAPGGITQTFVIIGGILLVLVGGVLLLAL